MRSSTESYTASASREWLQSREASHTHNSHSQALRVCGVAHGPWACEGRGSRRLSLRFVNAVRHENRASARAAASASDVHESHEPAGPPSCEPSEAIEEAAEVEGGIEAAADGGAEAAAVAAAAEAATAEAEAAEAEAAEAEAAEAAWQPHAACASCAEVS